MYFKRLEIFGFKSFADKTILNFEPGITAIVGPNGCGKSNIFDAIRWVLGEQSIKELRGGAMEDVIFNGTDKKPGLGFAEVSLTFSNESRSLPVDFNEVMITRRLFRSGESEYCLNKTPARLKDILELFMGTGIGSEAYSLVQQGKVDLVVSAKPEERRTLLDEASGITKYKAKRKEALSKLEDTENNLLRLNDIIIEVKRQISSLERQASKARRYKDEFEKLKTLEVEFANYEMGCLEAKRQTLQGRLEELRRQDIRLTEELKALNDYAGIEAQALEDVELRMNDVNARDIKLEGQIDINDRQIGFNEERLQNIDLNEKRLTEKKEQLTQRCQAQQEKIVEVQKALADLEGMLQQKQQQSAERHDLLDTIADCVKKAQHSIRQEEEKILGITSTQVQIKNKLTEVMKEVQGSLARKRRLEMENIKVGQEKVQVDGRLLDINQKMESALLRMNDIRADRDAKNTVIQQKAAELSLLEKAIDELEKKRLFFRSQKDFIEKMSAQYQDIPDPVVEGRLYATMAPLEHHTGIIGKVRGVAPVDDAKLQTLKGSFSPETQKLFEVICETKFIELDPLQISRKIEELTREILENIRQKDERILLLNEQKAIVAQLGLDIQEHEKTLSVFEAQKQDILSDVGKLEEELDLVKVELAEVNELLTSLKVGEDHFVGQLDLLTQEMNSCQLRIKEQQEFIALKSREREETTVMIAQLEAEIASLGDKRQSDSSNLATFSADLEQILAELNLFESEFVVFANKRKQFSEEIVALKVTIVELQEQKQSLRGVLVQHERQKAEILQRLESVKVDITAYNQDIEVLRNSLHTEQMTEQELLFKVKEIKDRLVQTYKIDIDALSQEAAAQPGATDGQNKATTSTVNPEEMQTEIGRLKKRCEAFGAVNLVAIEEFDELRGRFEFLTKQQSDLLTAKESLHETIRKINRQTRQMFMDTFTKVNEEFRIYFRMLFGGGEAQLILLDPENVLESGVEIISRPPGKKLQNISLLSGGEKSLTAIALIFGVFKVNPSPFCVLDEIDAALDESNVGRFSYLLKDFAKIAQFIVITHNKKTIANADVMYGITMEETGVSKIVSVKFADQERHKQQLQTIPAGV